MIDKVVRVMLYPLALWLEFEIKFLEDSKLPKWKGNLIRGVLGLALKKLYCKNPKIKDCYSCPYNSQCPYGFLYRTKLFRPKGFLHKLKYFSKPYTIKPPLETQTSYKKGDSLRFGVVLFGIATKFYPHIIYATRYLEKRGLGTKSERGKFSLERVYSFNPFTNNKQVIWESEEFYQLKTFISAKDLSKRITKNFKLRFLTPYQLISQNAIKTIESFSDIFPYILRKYSNILTAYTSYHPQFNPSELKQFYTTHINLISSFGEKKITIIYKNKKELYFTGEYTFHAEKRLPKTIVEALNFGMLSNVGKRAVYGHGWYEIIRSI